MLHITSLNIKFMYLTVTQTTFNIFEMLFIRHDYMFIAHPILWGMKKVSEPNNNFPIKQGIFWRNVWHCLCCSLVNYVEPGHLEHS